MGNVVKFDRAVLVEKSARLKSSPAKGDRAADAEGEQNFNLIAKKFGFDSFAMLDISERRDGVVFPHLRQNSFEQELAESIGSVEDMSNCSVFLRLGYSNAPFPFTTGLDCRTNRTPAADLLDATMDGMLNDFNIRGGYCVPVSSSSGKRALVMYFGSRAEGNNQYPEMVYDTIMAFDELSKHDSPWDNEAAALLEEPEYDWVVLLANGHTVSDIADKIGLSEHTANIYTMQILQKLGVDSVQKAIALL